MSEIIDCIAFIVGKIFWSISVFLKFLCLRLLDLFGLIFNLLACCTVFRLPFMIAQFKDMSSIWEWRFQGLIQLFIFLFDVPVFIMGVIICLTVIRVVPCARELSKNWNHNWKHYGIYSIGFELYAVVIKQFFTLFIDSFCVPSAVICLLSWRSVIFINRIRNSNSDWEKRKICFVEFLQVLVDAPLLLCFIPIIISWRLLFLIKQINEAKKNSKGWNQIRFLGIYQLFMLCLDIPCFLVLLITLVTWRSPILIRKLSKRRQDSVYDSSTQSKIRRIVFLQFFYIFIDIPCIIAAGFVFASFIHASTLINKIKKIFSKESPKCFTKKEFKLRRTCFYEFFMVFIDLICTVLVVIILLTIWRSQPLIKDIKKYFKRHKNSPKKEKNENKQYLSNEIPKEPLCEPCETVLNLADSKSIHEENETKKLNDKNKRAKDSLPWSKVLWKIRKSIVVHFVMLLVDIPAIPLCLFLLLTLLRAPKVISALISGQFYMLFSITVYYQTLRFFVDLFFMLLFIFLMFLRPIQSWIQLLEDEDHKKYRLTCEFMLWIPDIVNKRKSIYNSMNEVLIVSIKEGSEKHKLESDLVSTMQAYIESIENLLKKFTDSDIEDEITYLLECINLLEKKRVGKLVRKFTFEKNFMFRPNITLHTENRSKWQKEMNEYEKEVEGYFQSLVKYKPEKIPLYETKSGLSLRSRKETRNVLIECLPRGRFLVMFGALLCCLPLYRAPTLLKKLYMRWYDRVHIVVCTLKEYLYDLLTIFRMILVILFIYRAPFMLIDVLDCIVEKRSWKSVREAVKEYPLQMLEDLFCVGSLLFSWKTPRFIISTLLFGLFMPADLLLGVIRKCMPRKCGAYLLTIIIYTVFMCFPLVLTFYITQLLLSKGMGWVNIIIFCVFLFLLLVTLLIMVTILAKDDSKKFLVEMPTCDYVRYSWFNMHVILFEIIELLQSVALVFKLPLIPMYGGKVLQTASMYMLLGFIPFKAVFWVTVLAFICWFFICGAPIILENILKIFPLGTCGKKTSWRLLVSLFANTLFVTIVENLSSFSACVYPKCQYTISLNDTCLYSRLIQDNSLLCWTVPHSSYAAFSLIALVWFMITSFVFGVEYGDPEATEQDIGFSPIYNSIVNIFKAVSIIAVTFITNNNYVVLGILLFSNVSLVIYTALFKRLFKHDACNLPSFLVWRVFSFVSSVVVTVAVIVAIVLNDKTSKIPLIIIGSGVSGSLIVSITIALKLRQISDISRDREEYRVAIILLKKKLEENNWLVHKWKMQNDIWLRLVKSVREAKKGDKHVSSESWNLLPPQPSSSVAMHLNSSIQSVHLSPSNITVEASNIPSENHDITHDKLNQIELVGECAPLNTYFETNIPLENNIPSPPTYDAIDSVPAPPKYDVCLSGYDPIQQTMLYEDSMLRLQKNGRNLLLILEQHINYEAFKYSFFSQRSLWLNAVCNSNWTGLVNCLQILNSNVDGSFYRPTPLDISLSPCSLETDILEDENAESEKPKLYVKLTKTMRDQLSADIRAKALQNISELEPNGDKWQQLFEKLLPTTSIIKAWNYESDHQFSLILNKPATGKIVEIAEGGNKLAKGATVSIKKKIMGTINYGTLSFTPGFEPVAKKGPIAINVNTVSIFPKNNCWYIEANGKKVKFDVGMASCKKIQWS